MKTRRLGHHRRKRTAAKAADGIQDAGLKIPIIRKSGARREKIHADAFQ